MLFFFCFEFYIFRYAAKIEEAHSDGTFTVVFTDYGNKQVCTTSQLRKKDEKVSFLLFAFCFS